MPNRLKDETSPYLLQHADNPVDWYPWGEEAFKRARALDRPILLSIGYSACHWCHVMAHESFQNPAIAEIMNRHFVSIKVDREERPDVDQVYMEAVQAMTGSGGWPLTVFLTPNLKPFFGGTYFPPQDRQNLPGFARVLLSVAEAYQKRRAAIDSTIDELSSALTTRPAPGAQAVPGSQVLDEAERALESSWDRKHGGFGGAPKFPHPMALEFLMRRYLRVRSETALQIVTFSLDKMAQGGMYDQVGGGFHRYATDSAWQIPHFEKMLYDNALLSLAYLQGFCVTRRQSYARVAGETLDFMLREMRHEDGAFFSSLDADSEGSEGLYYLWTPEQISTALGGSASAKTAQYFGVTEQGNFEGRSILHVPDLDPDDEIEKAKKVLLGAREKRPRPGRDEKILTSWNALAIRAFTAAGAWLGKAEYLAAAESCAGFLLERMMPGGDLLHGSKDRRGNIPGFLDDYALTALALLDLNAVTARSRWLKTAVDLTARMVSLFEDRETGLLFDTRKGPAELFFRPRAEFDGATPAGTSSATLLLEKMAVVTGEERYRALAEKALAAQGPVLSRSPLGFSYWLCALDDLLAPSEEIIILGSPEDRQTKALLEAANSSWRPISLIAGIGPEEEGGLGRMPIFEGRVPAKGRPTAYLCRNHACLPPITAAEQLAKELASPASIS